MGMPVDISGGSRLDEEDITKSGNLSNVVVQSVYTPNFVVICRLHITARHLYVCVCSTQPHQAAVHAVECTLHGQISQH